MNPAAPFDLPPDAVLLAIESSCDETAAAVVARDLRILSNVVSSQAAMHARFGGVVPEVASRAHVPRILPVVDEALRRADVALADLSAIAVVVRPGLVGSLLVGLTAAKTLAWTFGLPLVAVDHVHAHLYACRIAAGRDLFPAVGLVVSGGHSNLYDCASPVGFELLGSTIDDAAGEAFDKVAAILGLPYPGGPSIEAAARSGDPHAVKLPRPMLHDPRLEFSFSGLKTAVLYAVRGIPGSGAPVPALDDRRVADVAAAFQSALVDVLVGKSRQALARTNRSRLLVGGGVAANALLRERLADLARETHVELHVAPRELCTDNAAMAGMAWESLSRGRTAPLDVDVQPGLARMR